MKSKKHLYITAFGGGFIGCILFISIYGFAVLNVTNVDWILNAGGDFDMLPLSRTLKNETYLGVLLCPGKVR